WSVRCGARSVVGLFWAYALGQKMRYPSLVDAKRERGWHTAAALVNDRKFSQDAACRGQFVFGESRFIADLIQSFGDPAVVVTIVLAGPPQVGQQQGRSHFAGEGHKTTVEADGHVQKVQQQRFGFRLTEISYRVRHDMPPQSSNSLSTASSTRIAWC